MGKVAFVVGDDVSTDVIYPGRYMATVLPTETPQYAFANDPALNTKLNAKQVPPGSVLVGGKVVNQTTGKSWDVVPPEPGSHSRRRGEHVRYPLLGGGGVDVRPSEKAALSSKAGRFRHGGRPCRRRARPGRPDASRV